jgi:hypothetical protein
MTLLLDKKSIYPIPVMTISKVKLVIPVTLEDTAKIKIVFITAPGSILSPA